MAACGLAVKRSAWQSLSDRDQDIVRLSAKHLEFGTPAVWLDGGSDEWFVFLDLRVTLAQLAYLGCLLANLNAIPPGYEIPLRPNGRVDRDQLYDDARTFLDPLVVLPKDIVYTQGGNVWQETLDAQGTPSQVKAADAPPDSWRPKG